MLEIKNLSKNFAGFQAINNVNFLLEQGTRHAIIGPNGAGKTTFFNLITGHLEPSQGDVIFEDKSIVGMAPYRIVKLGIARSFQTDQHISAHERFGKRAGGADRWDGRHFNLLTPAEGLNGGETRICSISSG